MHLKIACPSCIPQDVTKLHLKTTDESIISGKQSTKPSSKNSSHRCGALLDQCREKTMCVTLFKGLKSGYFVTPLLYNSIFLLIFLFMRLEGKNFPFEAASFFFFLRWLHCVGHKRVVTI